MKKIIVIGLFAILAMLGCRKDVGLLEGKNPEDRATEALEKFRSTLINSADGWIATVNSTEIKGSHSFYIKFSDTNRVVMLSDLGTLNSGIPSESTYRLKDVMAPSVIFDTYNLIHLLQDPNSSSLNGIVGTGYGADFEFEFREQVGDTLRLLGKKRKTELILVRATADQGEKYMNGTLTEVMTEIQNYLAANPILYIPDVADNTKKIQVSISTPINNRKIVLSALEGGARISREQYFSFSLTGMLNKQLTLSGLNIVGFEWDRLSKKLFALSPAGQKIEVLVSKTPIMPLHLLLGNKYPFISVPDQRIFPGWGSDFVQRRASTNVALGILAGLRLTGIDFYFDSITEKMLLTVGIPRGNSSISAMYEYVYTKSASGVFKFTVNPQYANGVFTGNASYITAPMVFLLTQRLNTDTFVIDYFVDPLTGNLLGQFKSVENPEFTFTGTL